MIINLIGDCDKRPVLYTVMKMLQYLGDVLLVTDNPRLLKLSDTRESGGHYQNTMICVTDGGMDDFLSEFGYVQEDFAHVIVDNIIHAEADLYVFVEGYETSEYMSDVLEYVENYKVINPFKDKLLSQDTIYRLERFESLRDMCPINKMLAQAVAKVMAKPMNTSPDYLIKMGTEYKTAAKQKRPEAKVPYTTTQKVTKAVGGKGAKR